MACYTMRHRCRGTVRDCVHGRRARICGAQQRVPCRHGDLTACRGRFSQPVDEIERVELVLRKQRLSGGNEFDVRSPNQIANIGPIGLDLVNGVQ